MDAMNAGIRLQDRYTIERVLGQGGFGITYLATDENVGAPVVIKEFFPASIAERVEDGVGVRPRQQKDHSTFRRGVRKMLTEGRTLSNLHAIPEIVRVLDCFQANGTAFLVMEFIRGMSLRSYIERLDESLSFAEVRDMLLPVMRALEQVHKKKLIHRDITPDNLLVRETGKLKIIDFGSAREFTGDERTRTVLIKPGYAPPEQYTAKSKQGPWTDVYSLCAVMYEMLTGVIPQDSLLRMHSDELFPPSMYGVEISPDEELALMRGLSLDYRKRFADMGELADALLPPSKAENPGKKRLWIPAAVLACAVSVIILAGVFFVSESRTDMDTVYAGNYDRSSKEHREFEDFVKSHALSKKETEEGVLYQLSPEDVRSWGQPCNRLRFERTVEDFLEKLGGEGYTVTATKETAAECSVEIYQYGAILTSFVNSGKYEIAPDLSLEIEYDLVNQEITEIVLRAEENAGDALTQTDSVIRHILSPYKTQMVYQRIEEKNTIRFVPYNTINWLGYGDRYYWP